MEERRSSQVSFGASADLVKESALLALLNQSANCFFFCFFGGGGGVVIEFYLGFFLNFSWLIIKFFKHCIRTSQKFMVSKFHGNEGSCLMGRIADLVCW